MDALSIFCQIVMKDFCEIIGGTQIKVNAYAVVGNIIVRNFVVTVHFTELDAYIVELDTVV